MTEAMQVLNAAPVVGVGKGWQKQICLFSWGSMLVPCGIMKRNHLIWLLFEALCADSRLGRAMPRFLKKLKWSFQILQSDEWPYCDGNEKPYTLKDNPVEFKRKGKPIAGGYCGVPVGIFGDWSISTNIWI